MYRFFWGTLYFRYSCIHPLCIFAFQQWCDASVGQLVALKCETLVEKHECRCTMDHYRPEIAPVVRVWNKGDIFGGRRKGADRQTDRHRKTQVHRQTDRQTDRYTQDKQTKRHGLDRQKDRQTHTQGHRQAKRQTQRQVFENQLFCWKIYFQMCELNSPPQDIFMNQWRLNNIQWTHLTFCFINRFWDVCVGEKRFKDPYKIQYVLNYNWVAYHCKGRWCLSYYNYSESKYCINMAMMIQTSGQVGTLIDHCLNMCAHACVPARMF